MTAIIDYGAGNLRSVQNTFDEIGVRYRVTNEPAVVADASKVVLPGVGHFGQMMHALDALRLRQPVIEKIRSGTPFLGICVGLQCLFESSEESPGAVGLAVLPGAIRRFDIAETAGEKGGPYRVPHMGWNSLDTLRESKLLAGLASSPFAYFAHSYYAPVVDATVATCTYSQLYSAVLERGNLFAVQFHPEKSGPIGLRVLKNFAELPC